MKHRKPHFRVVRGQQAELKRRQANLLKQAGGAVQRGDLNRAAELLDRAGAKPPLPGIPTYPCSACGMALPTTSGAKAVHTFCTTNPRGLVYVPVTHSPEWDLPSWRDSLPTHLTGCPDAPTLKAKGFVSPGELWFVLANGGPPVHMLWSLAEAEKWLMVRCSAQLVLLWQGGMIADEGMGELLKLGELVWGAGRDGEGRCRVSEEVNYRELLRKYIDHVGEWEGVSFIRLHHRKVGQFTEAEWQALRQLDGTSDATDDEFDRWSWAEKQKGEAG